MARLLVAVVVCLAPLLVCHTSARRTRVRQHVADMSVPRETAEIATQTSVRKGEELEPKPAKWRGAVGRFVKKVMKHMPRPWKWLRNPDGSKQKWWQNVLRLGGNRTNGTEATTTPGIAIAPTTTETTTWHWDEQVNNHDDAAKMLADKLKEKLVFMKDGSGRPLKLGEGGFGVVFLLEGRKVLKLGPKLPKEEAVVAMNLPDTDRLLHVYKLGEGKDWTGEVMPFVPGELTDYGMKWKHASAKRGLKIASDLAIGIYALHSKIEGYALMHCDMTPANSGWQCEDGEMECDDDSKRAFLLDFGLALVRKLGPEENISQDVFDEIPRSDYDQCRKTHWDRRMKADQRGDDVPFSGNSEWRQLGVLLIRLVEVGKDGWMSETYDELYKYRRAGACDFKCAMEKRLARTRLAAVRSKDPDSDEAKMLNFIEFLIFKHDTITDELRDVIGHPSFDGMSPSVMERANKIPMVVPSDEFKSIFSAKLTRLPA